MVVKLGSSWQVSWCNYYYHQNETVLWTIQCCCSAVKLDATTSRHVPKISIFACQFNFLCFLPFILFYTHRVCLLFLLSHTFCFSQFCHTLSPSLCTLVFLPDAGPFFFFFFPHSQEFPPFLFPLPLSSCTSPCFSHRCVEMALLTLQCYVYLPGMLLFICTHMM